MLAIALLPAALIGCRAEDEILQETVTHPDRENLRLRVAILERGDTVWFIRIDGPEAEIARHKTDIDAFVKSTEFSDKKGDPEPLRWKTPAGWKKDPPTKGRYATYRIDAKPKELELKVSMLDKEKYRLMDNIHRWQKQMNINLSETAKEIEEFLTTDKIGNMEFTWVDMKGLGVHTVSKAPDARAGYHQDFLGGLVNENSDKPFKYSAPATWKEVDPGKFAANAYEFGPSGANAKVTVSNLSGKMAGNVAQNVNRWRGIVGLEPQSPKDVAKAAAAIKVDGIPSHYFDIDNPKGPPAKNRTLAIMVPIDRQNAWFIVMTGPRAIVADHKNEFEKFVETFNKK